MTPEEHELLERVFGAGVLRVLDGRYRRFAVGLLIAGALLAITTVAALCVTSWQIGNVRSAQSVATAAAREAATNAANVRKLADENATLITRLERLAHQAQLNGARADRIQCREIERLKMPIREVLRSSPRARRFLPLFRARKCNRLPNAEPVKP